MSIITVSVMTRDRPRVPVASLLDRAWLQSDVEPSYADRAVPLRPDDLPDYERPPLVEVALAVQYQALPLRQAHLGLFWIRMIKDYPATQDLPPLEPSPGPWVGDGDPMITLELASAPRVNRSWFIGHEDTRLIQVQADRFVANWRSRTSDRDYPRFESILTEFSRSLQVYDETLHDNGVPRRVNESVEVTYVNWIADCSMSELLVDLGPQVDTRHLGRRADERIWFRWLLEDQGPLTRTLQMNAHTARRAEEDRVVPGCMLSFTFTAPLAPDTEEPAMHEIMNDGRNAIVRAFTAVTTTSMHERWGRLK